MRLNGAASFPERAAGMVPFDSHGFGDAHAAYIAFGHALTDYAHVDLFGGTRLAHRFGKTRLMVVRMGRLNADPTIIPRPTIIASNARTKKPILPIHSLSPYFLFRENLIPPLTEFRFGVRPSPMLSNALTIT